MFKPTMFPPTGGKHQGPRGSSLPSRSMRECLAGAAPCPRGACGSAGLGRLRCLCRALVLVSWGLFALFCWGCVLGKVGFSVLDVLHCMGVTPYGVPCVCKPLIAKRLPFSFFSLIFNMQGGRGGPQSSAQRSSLWCPQASGYWD